jgi:hypothetical protein
MDDLVKQAIQKWPNVPHCFGWLGLDQRGDWYMRDDQTQALGPFDKAKGSKLLHTKLIEFIQRNYMSDAHGQWYFQNGPQRVFVELQTAPFVWRIHDDLSVWSSADEAQQVVHCAVDELGQVYLLTTQGLGLVHTQDVWLAAEALAQQLWDEKKVLSSELESTYGFVKSPQQRAQQIT